MGGNSVYIGASPAGDENAISQMKELIVQNYNHPSIMFWGLSNEITIGGESEELIALHHKLNDLCHEMDKTRLTTMANVTMLEPTSELTKISDIMSYNHYFGWYVGDVSQNADWLDDFRKEFPDRPIGLSEYGCEAILTWHSSDPKQGDYTEEYQAYYHENMLKIFAERPYLWATHVWNMFDFGVDGRDEGGVKGRNNKGLVTYDRKTKRTVSIYTKPTGPMNRLCILRRNGMLNGRKRSLKSKFIQIRTKWPFSQTAKNRREIRQIRFRIRRSASPHRQKQN